MAQRASGFAKRSGAPDRVRATPGATGSIPPVAMNLAPLLAPYKSHGRLTLRIERVPQLSRLSAGRNNGNGSWSLSSEDVEGLSYLPHDGATESPVIAVRVLESHGDTLAVLEYPVPPFEAKPAARPDLDDAPGNSDALAKLSRLHTELAQARATLEARDAELAAARESWKAELDRRLLAAQSEAAAAMEKARNAWKIETESLVSRAEGKAQDRRSEARDMWKREAHDALMEAQAAWKAEEAKRLAAAEAKWREEAGKAVAAAKASMPQGESEDVRRLRADHARLQTAIAERDAMLAQVRAETEQIKARAQQELTRTQQERDTVIAGSRDEIQRLRDMQSALQTSLAERDAALARAQSAPQTSGADAAEMQRLRDAQATLQSSLTELDATLAQTRAEAEESANRAADDMRSMREAYAMIQAKLSERTAELAKFQSAGAPQAAETVPAPDTRELDRLREANADLRATLTQRDNAMTRLQEQLDQAKTAAPPPASPVDTRELDRLQETNADLRANLAQRDVAMAQLRDQLDQAKTGPRPDDVALRDANAALAELRARCERAEAALAEARTQAVLAPPIAAPLASPLDSDTQALRDELATLRSTLSDRESQLSTLRASQADEHQRWEQDAQATLTRAQLAWEADVAKRIADAEIEWQKNAGGALTEAQTRYKTAEANLAALRLRGDSMRDRTDSADLSRLRGDLAALQTTLGDREAQLVFARSVFESHGIKWPDANEMRSAGKSNFGPKRQERMEFVRGSAGMIAAAAFVGALVVFGFFLFPRLIGALPQDWQDDISVATEQMQNYIGDANRKIGVTAAETPAAAVVQALATVTRSANVRSAPSSASTVLVTLPRGTSVSTGIRSGNWVKVSIDGKTEGWIFAQYLKDSAPNAAIRK